MISDIKKIAIPTVDTVAVRGAVMVKRAAIPITDFRALSTETPDLISLSEAHPPNMFDTPRAKKGIHRSSPTLSNDTSLSALRYFGIQNIKK